MPTEEIFTTPDARRVDGVVRATCRFSSRAPSSAASKSASRTAAPSRCTRRGRGAVRTHIASDEGAARLGEVALVDGHSAVAETGLVFYDTLFDENAASHIAFGSSIFKAVPWAPDAHPRSVMREASTTRRSTRTS